MQGLISNQNNTVKALFPFVIATAIWGPWWVRYNAINAAVSSSNQFGIKRCCGAWPSSQPSTHASSLLHTSVEGIIIKQMLYLEMICTYCLHVIKSQFVEMTGQESHCELYLLFVRITPCVKCNELIHHFYSYYFVMNSTKR